MKLQPEIEKNVQLLAEGLAQQKVSALSGACAMMFTEVFALMLKEDQVTQQDIEVSLTKMETMAATLNAKDPEFSQICTLMTMSIRHAFQLRTGSKN